VALLAATLGALTLAVLIGRVHLPRTFHEVTWTASLIGLFAATEGFVIYLRVRRGAHAVSLADVPMILGLLAVNPFLVVGARLVGSSAGLFLIRRQRGTKLAFNVALVGVQATVAASVFDLIGASPGVPGPREWLAAYTASLLADVVAVVAVTAVIALHDDPQEWRRLPEAMRSVPFAAVATTVALVSVLAAAGNPWVLVLLAMLLTAVYLAYRTFVQQRHAKNEVEQLYAFTRALDGVAEMAEILPVVLDQVCVQLRAGRAELLVPERAGVVRYHTAGSGEMGTIRELYEDGPDVVAEALGGRTVALDPDDAPGLITVPVAIGGTTAALIVAESLPDAGPFTDARLHLLEALANHAGVALTKVALVEELRREAAEKEHLGLHDSLSGLPNRRYFHQLVGEALAAPGADAGRVAVLVADLDRFAETNDALGYDTGDALLVDIGTRLAERFAGRGTVARLGGDEFGVLLPPMTDVAEAVAFAEDMAAVIERPMVRGPITLHVRVSIGVAQAASDTTEALALVRHADVAMYAAKQSRSGVQVYDPAMDRNTPQRLARISALREAVDNRALTVVFQPKVNPVTMAVVGAEALVRWNHPMDGFIPPDEFIPLAEHSGLIRPLTLHVLETSLRQRARWARNGHPAHVAVNLSPNSLTDDELPGVVARLLQQTGTAPSSLTLEITESTLMTDRAGALATLEKLHALGVLLSIDDFGTGYSSLSRLRDMPIDEMKIDRSFVQSLSIDPRNQALVRSAIQMGHAMDLSVVAEGIEDAETLAYLASIGCDIAQGYHISRPLPGDQFAEWLDRHAIEHANSPARSR
jgi:diguanylate cyclase (GGDEF)-like protein